MRRNTVLANAVALALGVGSATALAATTIGNSNPPTFASEIQASATSPALLGAAAVQQYTDATLGFGVAGSQSVFLRFNLSGDGAVFATATSPTFTIICGGSSTLVAGGAGASYAIFQYTAPSPAGCRQGAPMALRNFGIMVTSTNATATISYGEYATAPDAANRTNPLASASGTLLKFAQTLYAVGNADSPFDIDISTNNTTFTGSRTVSPIGELALGNINGHLGQYTGGGAIGPVFLDATKFGPNPLLAATSSKDVLTVTGDFSAAPTTGSGALDPSAVFLSLDHNCGFSDIHASTLTATHATFNLGNTEYGILTATGAISFPEYVCYQVNGTTPIQFGVTYTAKYQPTAATGFTVPASMPLMLATLNTNGVTATVLNIPSGATGGDQPYIRIYNTSSLAGPIRGTLYGQDGTVLYSGVLIPSLAPGQVQVLTGSDLQSLAGQSWTGRAYLEVFGQIPAMDVQALIRDANGTLVNVSSKAPGLQVIETPPPSPPPLS